MVGAGRTGWCDVTETGDTDRKDGPEGPEAKKKKLFDLATIRGWIEAGGALVGVVGAAVGIYLQVAPVKKPSAPKPAEAPAPSVTQTGTGNVYGDGNTVTIDITGYTIEQHEARLKQQEETLRAQFDTASAAGSGRSDELAEALSAVQTQLADIGDSYQERLTELKRRAVELERPGGTVDASSVQQAASALKEGDLEKADAVIAQARGAIAESEPNGDMLTAQTIALDRPVSATIAAGGDVDVFAFRTPPTYRDRIRIGFSAKSATLIPQMFLHAGDKTQIDEAHSGTAGADLEITVVSEPGALYYVRAHAWSASEGAYDLTVVPLKSYDGFEPNDGLTRASGIDAGTQVEASILDKRDRDFYVFECNTGGTGVEMKLVNGSDALRPQVHVYDENKTIIFEQPAENAGSNIVWNLDFEAGQSYYIAVGSYGDSSGGYTLVTGGC